MIKNKKIRLGEGERRKKKERVRLQRISGIVPTKLFELRSLGNNNKNSNNKIILIIKYNGKKIKNWLENNEKNKKKNEK